MGNFGEGRLARRRAWRPRRRKTLARKLLDTPAIWVHRLADAAGAILSAARSVVRRDVKAGGREAHRAARAASDLAATFADDLDRFGGKAARLSAAAAQAQRPRRRGWFVERRPRAPAASERAHEGGNAGFDWIADLGAPLFSLWLTASGHARDATGWAADQTRKAADLALDRKPRGWLSGIFPSKARRVERAKAQTAAMLDEMRGKLDEMRRRALALGDGEAAQTARNALDRLSRRAQPRLRLLFV